MKWHISDLGTVEVNHSCWTFLKSLVVIREGEVHEIKKEEMNVCEEATAIFQSGNGQTAALVTRAE